MSSLNISIFVQQTTQEMISAVQPCAICNCTNTTNSESSTDQPLKVNGGFIAMAAGLSVIVPLICVLIIQLRRSKREERERAAAAAAAAAVESGLQPADDPPPSYEQLFGPTVNPVSDGPLHSRHSSLDILIEADETRRTVDSGGDTETNSQSAANHTSSSLDSGQRSGEEGYINYGYSSTSVSTISGSEVFDYPLSSRFSSRGNVESSSIELNQMNSIDSVDAGSSSTEGFSVSTSSEDMSSLTSGHSSLSSGQSSLTSAQSPLSSISSPSLASTSASSAGNREAPPPPPPPQALLTQPPPPPYRSPATTRSTTTSGQSSIQLMLRRLPGMHISIQDILASIRPQQDNTVNELPPPSYEEALKILQCAKLSSQQILGKTD